MAKVSANYRFTRELNKTIPLTSTPVRFDARDTLRLWANENHSRAFDVDEISLAQEPDILIATVTIVSGDERAAMVSLDRLCTQHALRCERI